MKVHARRDSARITSCAASSRKLAQPKYRTHAATRNDLSVLPVLAGVVKQCARDVNSSVHQKTLHCKHVESKIYKMSWLSKFGSQ